MTLKEFRQLRRDRRLVALMVFMPLVLLVVFGYAASFDVTDVRTVTVGPGAAEAARGLPPVFDVTDQRPGDGRDQAVALLRDGDAAAAVVTGGQRTELLLDGSQLFTARSALQAFSQAQGRAQAQGQGQGQPQGRVEVLFNPGLKTSYIMIPGLIGLVLVFVGTIITALGTVRERQAGTLEQLAVMPLRPRDVIAGKVLPYFAIALLDMLVVVVVGLALFDVPFVGSVWTFGLASVLFLLVTLGVGVLISTVSQNQGQAVMLALMTLLPQVLLSGLIFPVQAMAPGVRWIAYVLPLSYFLDVSRGVLLKGESLGALAFPIGMLAVLGVVVFGLALLRFRRDLAPRVTRRRAREPVAA